MRVFSTLTRARVAEELMSILLSEFVREFFQLAYSCQTSMRVE